MNLNWTHVIAISIVGVGGIAMILKGEYTAGGTLLGGILGYAFKNGYNVIKK